jgi:2-polyprenyl-3-methyl-5-hydroxy-6-metoxy-1,4-benzoquinol methylase
MTDMVCWICDKETLKLVKNSNAGELTPSSFAITNSDYGITHNIYKCKDCGFLQCSDAEDVLPFYEELIDEGYENTRSVRLLQEEKVLDLIAKYKKSGTLLDIGAGSGILVEIALKRKYIAKGVEPSKWLQKRAEERKIPITLGIFPNDVIKGNFDVITLVDVIEHVDNPKKLVTDIRNQLSDDGIFVMVTPDVRSLLARVLGFSWWHFRLAHIGYFSKETMEKMTSSAELKTLKFIRPKWYFSLAYLIERVNNYMPSFLEIPILKMFSRITVPLNLYDSWMGVYQKK